ncbi:MAG: hemerythrin family protein [Gallionella sp.]|nr:hemerythrin family protein [Gallionella sp.]
MSYQDEPSPWRLEWSDAMSVGIPEIDAEHQHFIQLVSELNESIIARMELEEIKRCMQAILADAAAHFAHEEVLLKAWGYPLAREHAKNHARITLALREIMAGLHGMAEYEWIDAGLKVKQALIEHILNEDMKYRDYCCASGGERITDECSVKCADGEPRQSS